jgi:hypothetical protein
MRRKDKPYFNLGRPQSARSLHPDRFLADRLFADRFIAGRFLADRLLAGRFSAVSG